MPVRIFHHLSVSDVLIKSPVKHTIILLLFTLLSVSSHAAPWIDVGDLRLRNNLQLLNDTGAIKLSLTTWPLMWSDVRRELEKVDYYELNMSQKSAVRELRFELRTQTSSKNKSSVELVAGTSRTFLRDFGSFQQEKGELHKKIEWSGDNLSFRLQVNLLNEPGEDLLEKDLYGTYLAGALGGRDGNWLLGVGAIDRWWGAGSQSSLILSNNAKPVPGVFFRTKQGQYFETPWLSWLGEWHFVSYIGQMESNRVIPEAKLTGMRFTFKPSEGWDVGLSRGMQWGGEGRDNGFSTFWKSLTTQGENEDNQAGNQLAGFDVRYGFALNDSFSMALHAQTIGEDEAGYMPARRTHHAGMQLAQMLEGGDFLQYELEYTNTTADAYETVFSNIVYEHHIYKSGYRYHGRALGASFDNDSEVLSLAMSLQQSDGALWSARLSYLQLNEDGVAQGNLVSPSDQSLYMTNLYYQRFLLDGRLKVGLTYLSKDVDTAIADVKKLSASVSWEYRY